MLSKHHYKKKRRESLSAFGLIIQIPMNVDREIAALEEHKSSVNLFYLT